MRFMCWHVEYVKAIPKEKGRSSVIESGEQVEAENALLIFANFEKKDEQSKNDVVSSATFEIQKIAAQLGVGTIVLNPFAHLFAENAAPQEATLMLSMLQKSLADHNFTVKKMSFGIFYELELKVKGHPLSRISRSV
ncbi:MAG: threonyl-tRNA synthetase editing domain-containing protein [Candidatus Marsarchaeota archaeon]|nr:threonyl-tRNA synthetase editing domain-containing protein [Candidatus Marsarchaeota archaeon]MCL5102142.1 threonyl-tRNA synthetase editing domain-containing protein [Candidatus Marsarchaeota archaeon]